MIQSGPGVITCCELKAWRGLSERPGRKALVKFIPFDGQSKLELGPITPWNCGPKRWWHKIS